jgi:prepilin-type processing-associated H-X9-DG protein
VPGSLGVRPRSYAKTGGKVAYNVLYADGHVVTEVTQDAAYDSIRFGNPGGIRSP